MMEILELDPDVQQRFSRDCDEHEQAIASLLTALREGHVEPDLAFRQCAMELHSVKGVAGVLEFQPVISAIGSLCEVMLRQDPTYEPTFLQDFGEWFALLMRCLRTCGQGSCDPRALKAAQTGQALLLSALTPRRGPLAPRDTPARAWAISPSAGRRLLLVDDSATICAALSAQLRERGYPVRSARNLAQTAELLAAFEPEIVVTDVHMPDVEGDELCRRIKSQMRRIVPVVLYSILPTEKLAVIARDAGADAYVHKGDGVSALIERMDELLSDEILF